VKSSQAAQLSAIFSTHQVADVISLEAYVVEPVTREVQVATHILGVTKVEFVNKLAIVIFLLNGDHNGSSAK
jgi:butyrate kinase